MPRALVASALPVGWQPPSTSPPLVAAVSPSGSVSTLNSSPGPEDLGMDPIAALRNGVIPHRGGSRPPRPTSVGSVGRGINTLGARRLSIFTDEDGEGTTGRPSVAMTPSRSSPPLSRMSLSSVGGLSSISGPEPSAPPTPLPKQRPSLSSVENGQRGHRTMLSCGSVRSFVGRSSAPEKRSPSPPKRPRSPALHHAALSQYESEVEFPFHDGAFAPPLSKAQSSASLLKTLLPPAAARYPHAPGHDTPRAFEQGCSKPPSPRPPNHHRHHRDGGEFTVSDVVSEAIEEALSPPSTLSACGDDEMMHTSSNGTRQSLSKEGLMSQSKPLYRRPCARLHRPLSLYTCDSPRFASKPYPDTSLPSSAASSDRSPSAIQAPSSPTRRPHHGMLKSFSFTARGPSTTRSIADAIRERRLQASSMSLSQVSLTDLLADSHDLASASPPLSRSMTEQRRTRSRGGTSVRGVTDLRLDMDFQEYAPGCVASSSSSNNRPVSSHSEGSRAEVLDGALHHSMALDSLAEVVMTPTTEEWRYLGGVPGKMRRFCDEMDGFVYDDDDPDDEDDDDEDDNEMDEDEIENTNGALGLSLNGQAVEDVDEFSVSTQDPPSFFPDSKGGIAMATMAYVPVQGILELNGDAKSVPLLNAMSTQSISTEASDMTVLSLDMSPRLPRSRKMICPPTGCSLAHEGVVQGPIDPRIYSAVTLARDINSFIIEGDAGNGAYGTVKRAREKGANGQAIGPPLIIKYIVKQKILADCWKKHKTLGPIPIEIHVLDHLRRVAYRPSVISANVKSHRRPPSGRQSTYGQPSSPTHSIGGGGGGRDPFAHITLRTGHPNICGILDYFEDTDYYYLVMPCFGEGQDLFDYVDLAPDGLPIHEVRSILGQVADAVAFLHEHNIVHRDIKDENVIMDGFGNVQLIDFGSAAYVKEGKIFDTFSGTLDFAAPEVLRGERHSGKEIDVWALGVLFYVLLCGECPFWNASECSSGVIPGSRARSALDAKCQSIRRSMDDATTTTFTSSNSTSTSTSATQATLASVDQVFPEDAVDLISKCLALEARHRPSAFEVCQHKFLAGHGGW